MAVSSRGAQISWNHCKASPKDVPWEWTAEHEEAYKASKGLLTTDDLLVHYDEKLPLILTSDASSYGLGSVLSHLLPNGKEAPGPIIHVQ
ncbi:hypothetical protein JTE90_014197 [Oedothorax gibbosus]|uniref:Reverse transcriptase/retrotransposon-derived protein RNase H-like domain-containing protein n=1 Tax=Oedothorax gibbosus TaxID=931172 RepID=A0AAV6TJU8_9ARAC|nr:hypothetical protein JTE90_014197 [Oedothorax gibbosus]